MQSLVFKKKSGVSSQGSVEPTRAEPTLYGNTGVEFSREGYKIRKVFG